MIVLHAFSSWECVLWVINIVTVAGTPCVFDKKKHNTSTEFVFQFEFVKHYEVFYLKAKTLITCFFLYLFYFLETV